MADDIATLRTMYDRFNGRDISGVLDAMADDVKWANGFDGGYVRGKEAVRDYWTQQWAQVSPQVTPLSFATRRDGEIEVQVQQDLFDLVGRPIAISGGLHSQVVRHIYHFEHDKVARFDIAKEV